MCCLQQENKQMSYLHSNVVGQHHDETTCEGTSYTCPLKCVERELSNHGHKLMPVKGKDQ
jgi:hypothetical protein